MNPVTRFGDMMRERSRPVNGLSRSITWSIAVLSVIQGAGILLGGPGRWVSLGYTVVRQLAPSWIWGALILTFGLAVIVASLTRKYFVKGIALFGISAWCAAFAGSSVWTIVAVRNSGTTGAPTYLLLAIISALMIFIDESRAVGGDDISAAHAMGHAPLWRQPPLTPPGA